MPTLRPRKRASPSSSSVPRSVAGDLHGAGVRPLQPGHHHQQRRFARAGRADEADRLAAAYMQVDVLEDMHPGGAAAERQIDAGQRDRGRELIEVSFMRGLSCAWSGTGAIAGRSYGKLAAWSSALRRIVALRACACCHDVDHGGSRARIARCSIVALGDSLTAGFGLRGADAFPAKLERALKAKGIAVADRQCRRLRRHRRGRARAARLVGAGRHRGRDRGTRRQRRAARRRSEVTRAALDEISAG